MLSGILEPTSGDARVFGLVPWRERAEVLRKGMLARVPPMKRSVDRAEVEAFLHHITTDG